jgi:hypothetical protein
LVRFPLVKATLSVVQSLARMGSKLMIGEEPVSILVERGLIHMMTTYRPAPPSAVLDLL